MPNWCQNTLTIKGDEQSLDRFVKSAIVMHDLENANHILYTKPRIFTFSNLYPVPDTLTDEEKYDWKINNWGCKWECEVYDVTKNDDSSVDIQFDSPWSPPIPFIKYVSALFPDVHFRLSFIETGDWFCGCFEGKNKRFNLTKGNIITTDEDGVEVEYDSNEMLYQYKTGTKDYLDKDFYPEYHNSCDYE